MAVLTISADSSAPTVTPAPRAAARRAYGVTVSAGSEFGSKGAAGFAPAPFGSQ